jgi:glycerol-3-phosphate cytidylyltransferase
MIYCFDIDGTICTDTLDKHHAKQAVVNPEVVEGINNLYDSGHRIIIFTSRAQYGSYEKTTKEQLRSWGLKYHELIYGKKPKYDVLVDSKAVNSFTWRDELRRKEKKIGLVASCFDLLHAGHCIMLQDARRQCDHLVAALQSDPSIERPDKNKPIQSLREREIQLHSIRYVDEIQVYDTELDLEILLKKIRPDVRILGSDYKDKKFTGQAITPLIHYHNRSHGWSTSELRERIKND